jgi:transposase
MKRVAQGDAKQAVVRRRRFTREFKGLVVQETLAPGASVSAVALKHRLNTNLLFTWRRRYLREIAGAQSVNLLPVGIEASEAVDPTGRPEPIPTGQCARSPASAGCIEIEVFGTCIRLKGGVDACALRSVLDVLSR